MRNLRHSQPVYLLLRSLALFNSFLGLLGLLSLLGLVDDDLVELLHHLSLGFIHLSLSFLHLRLSSFVLIGHLLKL